jgi:hypothetical protein
MVAMDYTERHLVCSITWCKRADIQPRADRKDQKLRCVVISIDPALWCDYRKRKALQQANRRLRENHSGPPNTPT